MLRKAGAEMGFAEGKESLRFYFYSLPFSPVPSSLVKSRALLHIFLLLCSSILQDQDWTHGIGRKIYSKEAGLF